MLGFLNRPQQAMVDFQKAMTGSDNEETKPGPHWLLTTQPTVKLGKT